ncbi:hypothetical protein RN001_003134 [Aquatica leii]|uniref:Uncharacterized protein n=1 Tax=Aquatica leii TaxID=1421715 RepID=A0AAN7QNX2_9COLE|nr:hypothetical protein RN001_003134 [Aquatica leii]
MYKKLISPVVHTFSTTVLPILIAIQKIALYETKARYYLVGSNNTQTRFRVLKIDRMEPKELVITDDKVEYTQEEIVGLLNTIDAGNRQRSNLAKNNISAFGIMGFIRFWKDTI